MSLRNFEIERDQIIMHTEGAVCRSAAELTASAAFRRVVGLYIKDLKVRKSRQLACFGGELEPVRMTAFLRALTDSGLEEAAKLFPNPSRYLRRRAELHELVEGLYDFWRRFDRFLVSHSEAGPDSGDTRPYRTFNATAERLNDLVRALYRDICENITGSHPRVYRQVAAGCDVGLIAVPKRSGLPRAYRTRLGGVPVVRQILINPPLMIDPPSNTRSGRFRKVLSDPLAGLSLDPRKFLCYPAQVGPLVVFVYVHERFIGLGASLANLFELATDEQVAAGPDALYVFGAGQPAPARSGGPQAVFFDDAKNRLLVAAAPMDDSFGYFGYLKKMMLTLHNAIMMKRGKMPFHGAMSRITLAGGRSVTMLLMGDTATGKSESLEAFRALGRDQVRELRVIADDMGSLEVPAKGRVIGYGTEIGAFIRLDDLQKGYAFNQIDRAIFMSPQKTNARVVLPVTTMEEVLRGYPIDILLYANNYDEVDAEHPIIRRFDSPEKALRVFREGAAMAKGTTTATGLGHSYFANIFGPPQYRALHEKLAARVFRAAFRSKTFVGQLQTRLAVPGYGIKGPEEAAKALLKLISRGW